MHVRRALALTAVVPLLLAGCSDDPEPQPKMPDPPPSSSPSPTASETVEAESAEEFIRRWVEVGDRMQVTGKVDQYEAMIEKTCKACLSFVASVKDVYDSGGSIEFSGATVNRVAPREEQPPTYAVTKTLPKTVVNRQAGAEPEVLPAGKTTLLVILKKRSDTWAVTYYGIL